MAVESAPWRQGGQVLGFALGRRERDTLAFCWCEVPAPDKDKPILTHGDAASTHGDAASTGFFAPDQHRAPLTKAMARSAKPALGKA